MKTTTNGRVINDIGRYRRRIGSQSEAVNLANSYLPADCIPLDRVTLSKAEQGKIILIPAHVRALASAAGVAFELLYPLGYC